MQDNRRPVATRRVPFFQDAAKHLVSWGLTPNQVSLASTAFAALGSWALFNLRSSNGPTFILMIAIALIGIQLRLLCNLIDGLMAVEGGLKTPTGELYNDVPDRFSDILLIVGAASAISTDEGTNWGLHLGWFAACLALLTAYIRVLGASLGQGHDFSGPMAKQHRMFTLNLSLIAAIFENQFFGTCHFSLSIGVILILIGSSLTVILRLKKLSNKLKV